MLKTLAIWIGALLLGFFGGLVGQRFSSCKSVASITSSQRAGKFELTDASGRVVSVWTVDRWGRPYLGMNDAKWEGRVIIGPILAPDAIGNEPPESDSWGIEMTAPGRTAHAWLGTTTAMNSKATTGFISLQSGPETWMHNATR